MRFRCTNCDFQDKAENLQADFSDFLSGTSVLVLTEVKMPNTLVHKEEIKLLEAISCPNCFRIEFKEVT